MPQINFISNLKRKTQRLLRDPVLRRWIVRRALRLEKAHPRYTAGAPPYLGAPNISDSDHLKPIWLGRKIGAQFLPIDGKITIDLPGATVDISSEDPGAIFSRNYSDLETLLAAHRFAWVPLAGAGINANWVNAIWQEWIKRFGNEQSGWPWHPYTAAERAINIIDFADRFGLPGNAEETVESLAAHAQKIRNDLEYFGDHYTSNHLSNNGRGLLRIGVALGLDKFSNVGAEILTAEANRIFGPSGLLREGSSHYHLLVTKNYIDAWLAADRAKLSQSHLLGNIAERAVAAIPGLCLPGGIPLIGDISPDAPPNYLAILNGREGESTAWPSVMHHDYREKVSHLIARVEPTPLEKLAVDGWHRFGKYDWQALTFIPPDGWPPMPGHGHQDLSSFELHDGKSAVIVDPGRGSYSDPFYTHAAVHSGLTIDDIAPVHVNHPNYVDAFRRRVIKNKPELERTASGCILSCYGFLRIRGVGKFQRQWRFKDREIEILDTVGGRGIHQISRRYITATSVNIENDCALLSAGGRQWRLKAEVPPNVRSVVRWTAYGKGTPGKVITFERKERLPFSGKTVLERL